MAYTRISERSWTQSSIHCDKRLWLVLQVLNLGIFNDFHAKTVDFCLLFSRKSIIMLLNGQISKCQFSYENEHTNSITLSSRIFRYENKLLNMMNKIPWFLIRLINGLFSQNKIIHWIAVWIINKSAPNH